MVTKHNFYINFEELQPRKDLQMWYVKGSSITLMWVQGHKSINGNKNADNLERQGAKNTFFGLELFCSLLKSLVTQEFQSSVHNQIKRGWELEFPIIKDIYKE